jgi:hypothetical protein
MSELETGVSTALVLVSYDRAGEGNRAERQAVRRDRSLLSSIGTHVIASGVCSTLSPK